MDEERKSGLEILRYFCRVFCLNAVNGFFVENESILHTQTYLYNMMLNTKILCVTVYAFKYI